MIIRLCLVSALAMALSANAPISDRDFALDPILPNDPNIPNPGYSCFLLSDGMEFLTISLGPFPAIRFKPDGRLLIKAIGSDKFRWMQEFGFEVDGVTTTEGSVNIPDYQITLRRTGEIRELIDGQSIPVSVTVAHKAFEAAVSGRWACGG